MKVFISGPMSGKPNGNKEEFFKAEYKLKGLGYSVFNPAWLRYGYNTEFSEYDMRSIDFTALDHCDAIYMLKGWQYSKGAKAEFEYAKMHGKQILRENDPITDPMLHDSVYGLTAAKFDTDSDKNTPVFDKEFAYDEAIKNRTNYQLEAIKENIKEKYNNVNQAINDVEANLDNFKDETDGKMDDIYDTLHRHGENIDTCQNDIDTCLNDMDCLRRICNNRHADNVNKINSLKKEVEAIKESIGTDNLQEQLEKDFSDVYEEFQDTKDKVNDIEFGYIDWSSKMSSAIDEMEKVRDTVKGLNSLVATLGERNGVLSDNIYELQRVIISSDIENISIKAMNQKLIDLGRELDVYIDDYKEAYKHLNNADDALERRIKAIEKRLSIKPFYAPTEDEKDD